MTTGESGALERGRQVLRTEARALEALAAEMPGDYEAVVALILGARGRVVVSGVGKSGHVGRKIAATLASTGTPAQFVHGTEASHGDLGMISSEDICLVVSNSGETAELRDVVAHSRRFSIPLVALSAHPGSTLMRAADYRLTLPEAEEACPMGLAPTTSTTLAMAMGDALAVTLMERRGFRPETFRLYHPGGTLGAQLVSVGQLMHGEPLPLVERETPMSETLLVMTARGYGLAAVVSEGRLAGLISDGDLRRHMAGLMERTAGDIATPHPVTVSPETLAVQALALMNERAITALMVVDEGDRPLGVLHMHDCLRAGLG